MRRGEGRSPKISKGGRKKPGGNTITRETCRVLDRKIEVKKKKNDKGGSESQEKKGRHQRCRAEMGTGIQEEG